MRFLQPSPQLQHGFKSIPQMRNALPIVFAVLLVASAGCSEPCGTVSGKVTYKDKPLAGGTVVFIDEDNIRQDRVQIQPDGTYSSKKVPVGSIRVGVEPAPKGVSDLMPKGAKPPPNMPEGGPKDVYNQSGSAYVDIPEELRDPTTSKITLTVNRGEQEFNIPLKDPK